MGKIETDGGPDAHLVSHRDPSQASRRTALAVAASIVVAIAGTSWARSAEIDADKVIRKSQAAIGGTDLRSIDIRGVGPGSLFGQAFEPGFAWPKLTYTSLTRVLDFENEAYREDATRTRNGLRGGGATPPFGRGDLLTIGFLKDGVGVPHGHCTCVSLPSVLRWNKPETADKQREIAIALGEPATEAADLVAKLIVDLGMPDRLHLVGVERNQFDLIAKNAMLDRWVHANPRKISRSEDVLEILELAA